LKNEINLTVDALVFFLLLFGENVFKPFSSLNCLKIDESSRIKILIEG